ncbi:hypothetical protein [Capnocytophaga sputigena]|jgi:hypothetical protein|uniref:hypothetical protein n=1 Tax=Capnocytophaga sputigena TaxID=1019 RepID=UPI000F707F62|nr:hypothetical protein [Capnocytophaga sputigena]VEI54611.1 Uncharacterised protein [Capnocytophaga sputigena]
MKKIFFLLVAALTVVTCGKSDDNNGSGGGNTSVGKFLPPKWIQGAWTSDDKQFGYAFKAEDFCQITLGNTNCFKEKDLPVSDIKDEKTDNTYKVSYKINTSSHTFLFEKVNEHQIKTTHNGRVEGIYTKQ